MEATGMERRRGEGGGGGDDEAGKDQLKWENGGRKGGKEKGRRLGGMGMMR